MITPLTAAREALEKISERECSYKSTALIELAIAKLRAAEAEAGWRPIAEAKAGAKLDHVGVHTTATKSGWLKGDGFYKDEAICSGFTHFLMLPAPPAREGK
ncbi:MAG: hypothetical protein EBR82_22545 [Caulobacteraceae bacterium]|nr:hypothetical protein [Caulobacteraceae bacterium]